MDKGDLERKRELVRSLVGKYNRHRSDYLKSTYNETQARIDFMNPLLEIFGWDIQNIHGLPYFLREVVQEESIEIEEDEKKSRKKPDYTLKLNGIRVLFVEAKKPSLDLVNSREAAYQIRRYGWNANLPISIITNFENLVVYDCRFKPEVKDNCHVARVKLYSHKGYEEKFEEIYEFLSKDEISKGSLSSLFPLDGLKGSERFDQHFLSQIEAWRNKLASTIITNKGLDQDEINYLTQQTLNRIIFLRICEDRDTEKYEMLGLVKTYEDLKKLFIAADRKYDSGIFDFIEDKLSLKIKIDDRTLIEIFEELYFPLSPYAFSIVEPKLLGEIYELFLSKEIIKHDNKITIEDKPEIMHSKGAISTPEFIAEKIVRLALDNALSRKKLKDIAQFSIADIACGSGIFLLSAYNYLLNFYLSCLINNDPEKQKELVKIGPDEYKLSLSLRRKILITHIFGVDIDYQAVQVTIFSLLLKLLESVNDTEIKDFISKNKEPVLPKLTKNIQWGNSLLDNSFNKYCKRNRLKDILSSINPLNFEAAFKGVMTNQGFDVLIGNPPYIRIQKMMKYSPFEVQYYSSDMSPYQTSRSNNYDKHFLFIERALQLIKERGVVGFIVPHKFFVTKAGISLRRYITDKSSISHIIHFGVTQVFKTKTSTYTCILLLQKKKIKEFKVEHVKNIDSWVLGNPGNSQIYQNKNLNERVWIFVPPELNTIFIRIERISKSVLKCIADIFVGVQTSADKIFLLKPSDIKNNLVSFKDTNGIVRQVEKSILRPCLHDVQLDGFSQPVANAFLIFPYIIKNGVAKLINERIMKEQFPLCWDYLKGYEDKLNKRDIPNRTGWYQYGRSQSLTKFDGRPKLIWPVLSLRPKYTFDDQNILITGGGNGPYYSLRSKDDENISLYYLLAILSHPVIESFIRARSSLFRGGYGSHGKQFIENIPFPKPSKKDHSEIVELTKDIIKHRMILLQTKVPTQSVILERRLDLLMHDLFLKINHVYNLTEADTNIALENLDMELVV